MTRFSFSELLALEKKYDLWSNKFLGVPVWYYIREHYTTSTRLVKSRLTIPNVINIIRSIYFLLRWRGKKFGYIFCLIDRKDTLDFYYYMKKNNVSNSLLIVSKESGSLVEDFHLSSDMFDTLRFFCRKLIWIRYFSKYQSIVEKFSSSFVDISLARRGAKNAIGDVIYNVLLNKMLPKNDGVFYCGAVVPTSEKFSALYQSVEVQHGVIHRNHPGYVGVPGIKNELVLYGASYKSFLLENGYSGRTKVVRFKTAHTKCMSECRYSVVVYTQPIIEFSQALNDLVEKIEVSIYIKRHPRDDYKYSNKFLDLKDVHPSEVVFPVLYTSSIIEDFLINDRVICLLDVQADGIDLDAYLEAYSIANPSLVKKFYSVEDLARVINHYFSMNRDGMVTYYV